jgi:hypothetical protein
MTRTARVLAAAAAGALASDAALADNADQEAVKAVVRAAYVEGVHAKPDPAAMRAGFHPDFRMYVVRNGVASTVTLEEWAARVEKVARERTGPGPQIRHEFTQVDVTGNAAVARVELHRDGKHEFTDYLSLYRFPDGWKIVAKIFHSHPN